LIKTCGIIGSIIMINVGITGQSGFIGTHLFNYLNLQKNIETIPFKDEYFQNRKTLSDFAKKCDCIVHLAALNRHDDPQEIYNVNINLVYFFISEISVKVSLILSNNPFWLMPCILEYTSGE